MLSKELLKIIACPHCKSDLNYNKKKNILTCAKCKKVYQIKDDIPILL